MKKKSFSLDALAVDKKIIDFIKGDKSIKIDKYSMKGNNGELFFGEHKILNKRVALKFYYLDTQKFAHKEVQMLSQLKNKNILPVLDAKEINNEYAYFLTPEIMGGDLDRYMQNCQISIFRAMHIVKGVLNGLTELHGKPNQLVHRDLKPGNILIESNGTPIIADFGSIQVIPKNQKCVKASKHSFIYCPPEAIKNKKYFFESDIYQVGILLYQLLRGYFPYKALAWLNDRDRKAYLKIQGDYFKTQYFNRVVGNKICKGKLLDYGSLPKYVCRKLKGIIRKATNSNISKRYRTTSEMFKDIHDYLSSAVNWRLENDTFIAVRQGEFMLRVAHDKKGYFVQRNCKDKKWRAYNKINGSLYEIFEKINSI